MADQCAITGQYVRISLDRVVWTEIVRLLEDPSLIQTELDRRLAAARTADPARQRENVLHREMAHTRKSIDRLLTAYQEELLSLDELRQRMPELRHREHALQTELQAILEQVNDRAVYLRLAETLSAFLAKLRSTADTLDIQERQRIVRLIVKEILIGDDTIVIRHSIPLSTVTSNGNGGANRSPRCRQALVIKVTFCVQGVMTPPCGVPLSRSRTSALRGLHRRFQPAFHVEQDPRLLAVLAQSPHQEVMIEIVEQASNVELYNPVIVPAAAPGDRDGLQRRFPRPIAIGIVAEDRINPWLQPHLHRRLRDPIGHRRHSAGELHLYPTKLWDRVRSLTRFTRYVANSLSF